MLINQTVDYKSLLQQLFVLLLNYILSINNCINLFYLQIIADARSVDIPEKNSKPKLFSHK